VRAGLALALALLALPLAARAARAHATLVSAEPAPGSRLAAAPARLRLVFSEPIEGALGRVTLLAASGAMALAAGGDPRDVHSLVAPLPALADGGYRVAWRIVSADGHPVDGSFTFSIGDSTAAPPPEMPDEWHGSDEAHAAGEGRALAAAPPLASALRGLGVGALAALAGLLGFAVWGAGPADGRVLRLSTWLALAAAVLLALHAAAWVAHVAPDGRLRGDAAAAALATGPGRVETARLALAVLALWALALARREGLALAFAGAAVLASGATGHAAAVQPLVAVPTKAFHLAALAAWLGGLVWLALQARAPEPAAAPLGRSASRVSAVALLAIAVVLATGVLQTVLFLPRHLDALRSAYGVLVLAKLAGLGVLALFGAHHRYRVLPRLAAAGMPARLARSLRAEMAVMAVVVLLGGLLAYVPPPPDGAEAHVHTTP
jgi:copper transport protein